MAESESYLLSDEFEFNELDKRELAKQRRALERKLIDSALHWHEISNPWPSFLTETLRRFRPQQLRQLDQKISVLSRELKKHRSDKQLLLTHGRTILTEIEKLIDPSTREAKESAHLNALWVRPLTEFYLALKDYQEICELSELLKTKDKSALSANRLRS